MDIAYVNLISLPSNCDTLFLSKYIDKWVDQPSLLVFLFFLIYSQKFREETCTCIGVEPMNPVKNSI